MKGILTLTIITRKANSLNYGESIGNVSILKKVSLGDGSQITYVSDKALKYDVKRKGKEEKGWKLLDEKVEELLAGSLTERIQRKTRVRKREKKREESLETKMPTLGFTEATQEKEEKESSEEKVPELDVGKLGKELIKEYHEFDLFGGLFTNLKGVNNEEVNNEKGVNDEEVESSYENSVKRKEEELSHGNSVKRKEVELSYGSCVKRTAPVKITYAYSTSKFRGDMDFMNNIDAYNRYIKYLERKDKQAISQSEQHYAYYYYTITVDLDRIGVWEGEKQMEDVLSPEEKANRVKDLLDVVMTLSRQIRGRYENLSPIFVIGGIYKVKNPFFMGGIDAKEVEDGKLFLNVDRLLDCKNLIPEAERENTLCGMLTGFFVNEQEIREKLNCKKVEEVFDELKKKVNEVYGVSETCEVSESVANCSCNSKTVE